MLGSREGVGLTQSTPRSLFPVKEGGEGGVNRVRMVVSPLWRGPGDIHGFVLDEKSY